MPGGIVRIETERLAEGGRGFTVATAVGERDSEMAVEHRIAAPAPDGGTIGLCGIRPAALAAERVRQVHLGPHRGGRQLQRIAEHDHRFALAALRGQRLAEGIPHHRIPGSEVDGPTQHRLRLGMSALTQQRDTEVVMRVDEPRRQRDGPAESAFLLGGTPEPPAHDPETQVGERVLGTEGDGSP